MLDRLCFALLLVGALPAAAQVPGGRVAGSAVGTAGQRQTRDNAASGIVPAERIGSRIQNRVQSRIRNRIDRNYAPQANTSTSFDIAQDQARVAGRTQR